MYGRVRGRMTSSFMATIDMRYGVSCLHQLNSQNVPIFMYENLQQRPRWISILSRYESLLSQPCRQKPSESFEKDVEYQDSDSCIE
jgi:hypothetical protein